MTSTKCHIDTVIYTDDGHIVARNMYIKEINLLRKIVLKLVLFTGQKSNLVLKSLWILFPYRASLGFV